MMLKGMENILNHIQKELSAKSKIRDECLILCRKIIKDCGFTIKHIHRDEKKNALTLLRKIHKDINYLKGIFPKFPSIYFAGYILDAQKEYSEARIFYSIIYEENIPSPEDMKIENSSYLQGMGEVVGELRRYILNCIKSGRIDEAEKYFKVMDEIYYYLFGFDYPEGIVGGLRRIVDVARSIIEKTHGDITMAVSQNNFARYLEIAKNKFLK